MSIWYWRRNAFKIFGHTLFRVSIKNAWTVYRLLGLPIWAHKSKLAQLLADVAKNKSFDVHEIDQRIEELAVNSCVVKPMNAEPCNRVAYLASELYVSGGHTKCVRECIKLLKDEYEQGLFLTRYITTKFASPTVLESISEDAEIYGKELNHVTWKKDIIELYDSICSYAPKVIFVFIHPDDVYGAMLLALLKKNTDIGILYSPHASHYPNVGLSFSDLTLEGMPSTAWITRKKRNFPKTHLIGMASKKIEDFPSFTKEQIERQRHKFGVKGEEVCTMSGGSAYKFFDSPDSSEYFRMIKRLLELKPQVTHVILSDFSAEQTAWIRALFADSSAQERLILHPLVADYELIFSCADLFLDSFPVSAALTMIDLMRLRVPSVVKINTENILWSFHEYQKPDYPYMFERVDAFVQGAIRLIEDKEERKRVAEENYRFYLAKYEGGMYKKHLCEIVENFRNLELYVDTDPASFTCRGKGTEK